MRKAAELEFPERLGTSLLLHCYSGRIRAEFFYMVNNLNGDYERGNVILKESHYFGRQILVVLRYRTLQAYTEILLVKDGEWSGAWERRKQTRKGNRIRRARVVGILSLMFQLDRTLGKQGDPASSLKLELINKLV